MNPTNAFQTVTEYCSLSDFSIVPVASKHFVAGPFLRTETITLLGYVLLEQSFDPGRQESEDISPSRPFFPRVQMFQVERAGHFKGASPYLVWLESDVTQNCIVSTGDEKVVFNALS